jgi:lysozyme family protein
MKENFRDCLTMLLKHEGGFVNHPQDPGGMTNLGVTKAVYEDWLDRKVDESEMRALSAEDVAPLYKARYWDRAKCDDLPSGVDWAVFDWAVNSGVSRAAKALQRFVGVDSDGAIGPMTIQAVKMYQPAEIIEAMGKMRQDFYEGLSTFDTFGRGWTRRNEETTAKALEMAA